MLKALLPPLLFLLALGAVRAEPIQVGSKRFTEGYVLGEIVTQTLQAGGFAAQHRQGLGNTAVLDAALRSGRIAVYPEYTGTLDRELLQQPHALSDAARDAQLAARGLAIVARLGFHNGYALALREERAAELALRTLSDLAALGTPLRIGLTHEFLARADGWPALAAAYGLTRQQGPSVRGLDHGLALQALAQGELDLTDVYTTDAQIRQHALRVLHDDRGFFPRYDAVLLARTQGEGALPEAAQRLLRERLEGRLDEATLVRLNAQAEIEKQPFDAVARGWLAAAATAATPPTLPPTAAAASFWQRLCAPDLPRLLAQHLALVVGALALALLVGLPLALLANARPRLAAALQAAVGLLQTIPSLALLALGVALLGRIGPAPALLALAAYALLPIVANTLAGLAGVPRGLVDAGRALGLREGQLLRHIRLPLAAPVVWTGVTTATVVNVGTATVAAFVGAGGLGERIVAGLAVNDAGLMLAGAVPAAVLAVGVQAGMGWAGRRAFQGARWGA